MNNRMAGKMTHSTFFISILLLVSWLNRSVPGWPVRPSIQPSVTIRRRLCDRQIDRSNAEGSMGAGVDRTATIYTNFPASSIAQIKTDTKNRTATKTSVGTWDSATQA
jgi:hypothetical protein